VTVVLIVFIIVLIAAIAVMVRFIMVWRRQRADLIEFNESKYGETRIDAPSFKNPYSV